MGGGHGATYNFSDAAGATVLLEGIGTGKVCAVLEAIAGIVVG